MMEVLLRINTDWSGGLTRKISLTKLLKVGREESTMISEMIPGRRPWGKSTSGRFEASQVAQCS